MMTDHTPARSLEGEQSVTGACLMTHEARKFLVPRVRKAVGHTASIARRSGARMELRSGRLEEKTQIVKCNR